MRFLFLLFAIPQLLFASFSHDDCHKVLRKINAEWVKREQLLQQFINLAAHEQEKGIPLLQEAIVCCEKAIRYCDKILAKIAKKSKSEKKETWWVEIKKGREQQKLNLQAEINTMKEAIQKIHANVASQQMEYHYRESERIALLAQTKIQTCSQFTLENIKDVFLVLQEVIQLYIHAKNHMGLALAALLKNPFFVQTDKEILESQIDQYSQVIEHYRKNLTQLTEQYTRSG